MKQITTNTIIDEQQQESRKDRREGKGRVLALSRRTYRLQNTSDVYYVEYESSNDHYYFVKFKPDDFEFCTCKDFELKRTKKCKHLYAIEFAIKWGIIKDTDKVPPTADIKGDTQVAPISKSYKDDGYTF